MDEARFERLIPVIKKTVRAIAWRRRLTVTDAEDLEGSVMVKLLDNDYAVLRRFQGRCSIETFITTVVANVCEDQRIREWGKWRPSAAAQRAGDLAVLLERYIVRDGMSFEEACTRLRTEAGALLDIKALEHLAATLPNRLRRRMEPEDSLDHVPSTDTADTLVRTMEKAAMWERIESVLRQLRASLSPRDAAVFAMRFDDGRKISEIAAAMGLEQRPLYDRIDGMKTKVRSALEAAGIDRDVIRTLLED